MPADTPALVQHALEAALTEADRLAAAAGSETAVLMQAASRAVSGGKRLRARLCLAAAGACGAPVDTALAPAVRAAAALELFQAAALVHDDLMDASDTRRGEPAAHRWLAVAVESRPGADATRFGDSAAVLLGDLLLTMSATALHDAVADTEREVRRAAAAVYAEMSTEVALGQFLDLVAAHVPWHGEADLDRAWRVVRAKSARYSVELPLALGARLAGADDATTAWFTAIGSHVGTAFQLRDDLLGVFGDPEVTGKPAGDDLREGKRTVLVALAALAGSDADREHLLGALGHPDLDAAAIAQLRALLERTGAVAQVEALIAQHTAEAHRLLEAPPTLVSDTAELEALVAAATQRSA
ncbi:polyprenyl synthetase family protein [Miniimonas arenae]|uniref:polyprenyl synthetase family protein n=1 Tax=Miniimonas arenae TaxID=676201 RepID=UPI0028AD8442|nr:polyprenyl synthetase family protein [Miniimonas arenae]